MIDLLLSKLKGVRSTAKGYEARCPTHPDRHPSLNIDPGSKGWLLYCHRGCSAKQIMGALGFPVQSLYYDYKPTSTTKYDGEFDVEFASWVDEEKPWSPCWKHHTFNEVAWAGIPRAPRGFAQATVQWYPYTLDPFERTMRMWVIMSDSWLYTWLGELWSAGGRTSDWYVVKRWAADRMWGAWISGGCSVCEVDESPQAITGF